MKILVFVKQVPDTDDVKLDPKTGNIMREGVASKLNPLDANAVEAAIQLKEKYGAQVCAISMGPPQAEDVLKKALALGCDEAYLLSDRAFGGADTLATSYTLAMAARKIGDYDLLLFGRHAVDGDTAQTGPQIGEKLDCAVVTYLEKLDLDGNVAIATRDIGTGVETCRAKLPALFTVTEKFGELRPYEMRRVMKYKNAEPTILDCAAIGCEDDRCGFAGSPTSVNKIESVVLAGGEFKEVAATDEGIGGLVAELIKDHTIG